MKHFRALNPIKFFISIIVCMFLISCSSEEDNQQVDGMTAEEMSEFADAVVDEMAENGELDVSQEPEVEYTLNENGLPEFLKVLESNEDVKANYNACPVTIFQKHKSYEDHLSINDSYEDQCAKDPAGCLKQCIEDRNGVICHDLAYVLEGNEGAIGDRYGKMMYAQACATGWPLSCTNRSAGIRNALKDDDPFFKKDESETNMCLNATFEKMCDEEDAWGCYMTGSSYEYGDGREVNEAKAEEYYNRACEVDGESGACGN